MDRAFGVKPKILKIFPFLSKVVVLHFTLTRPISGHFKVWNGGQGLFCVCPWVSNGSSSFVAKTYLPPLKCFCTFVKRQLGSFVSLCFSDSLLCSSVWVYLYHPPIPHCLDYRSYIHLRLMKSYHVLQYTWQDPLLSTAEQKKGAFLPPRWRHFPSATCGRTLSTRATQLLSVFRWGGSRGSTDHLPLSGVPSQPFLQVSLPTALMERCHRLLLPTSGPGPPSPVG